MPTLRLRRTHPNFFISVVGDVQLALGLGLVYMFLDNTSPSFKYIKEIAPLPFFGALYAICGVLIILGIWGRVGIPMVFRFGLALGIALTFLFAVAFGAATIDQYVRTGKVQGAGGLFSYMYPCINFIAQVREPRRNPETER